MLVDINKVDATATAAKGAVSASVKKSAGQIGSDFRPLCGAWGWTLDQHAEQLDCSVGWLFQVERGASKPALDEMRTGVFLFSLPFSFFFSQSPDTPESKYIVRADYRRAMNYDSKGFVESPLSLDLSGAFEIVHSFFGVGMKYPQPFFRPTEEAGYDIDGSLTLIIDDREFALNNVDSPRFAG